MSNNRIVNTDNPRNVPHEDDSRWDVDQPAQEPSEVERARAAEAEADALVQELIELVETGRDLSAVQRIPAARQAAEEAGWVRKGVENQDRERRYEDWKSKVDDYRAQVAADREEGDDAVATTRSKLTEALQEHAEALVDERVANNGHRGRIGELESAAKEFDGFNTASHLRAASSMVRPEPKSPVELVFELAVSAVRPVVEGGFPLSRRDEQWFALNQTYTEIKGGSLQQVLRGMPNRLGYVAYGADADRPQFGDRVG